MEHKPVRTDEELKKAADAQLRVLKHLPQQGDLSVIVLKGHLLIEELLLDIVLSGVKHPEAIESANLSFFNLASIAKALYFEDRVKQFWDAVFQLNSLRNSLAHNIEPQDLKDRLRRFALAGSGGNADASNQILSEPEKTMVASIETMCGFFIGLSMSARKPRGAA